MAGEAGIDIAHIVYTTFNLATRGREAAVRQAEGWLASRFDLFEKYCLPSMAAQTATGFTWLILFDTETPDWARERIAACRQQVPFTPVFTEVFDAGGWARLARAQLGPPVVGRVVLTSNLDNDDALAADYLERVEATVAQAWQGRSLAVNLPDGMVLARGRLYRHRHLSNAFTNLAEADSATMRTVNTIRHMEMSQFVPIIQAAGGPGWLQVIHGANVSNKVRGRLVARPRTLPFPASSLADLQDPTAGERLLDNLLLAPVRWLRDRAFRLARRIIRADRHVGKYQPPAESA